jgi:hypothetical protein
MIIAFERVPIKGVEAFCFWYASGNSLIAGGTVSAKETVFYPFSTVLA